MAVAGGVAGEGGEVAAFHGFGPADVGAFERAAEDGVDAGGPAEGWQEDGGESGDEAAAREWDGHWRIVWGGSGESARRKFGLGSAGGEVVPCAEAGGFGVAFEGAETLVLLAFRGTERVIGAGGVDAGEAGGDEGFGEVGGLALSGSETDVGVEALAVEDPFPSGEDGEGGVAQAPGGEVTGILAGGEHLGFREVCEVTALIVDASGAGTKSLGFRAVDEVETEDVFFSGGGDAEAVAVVGAAGDEAAAVELDPCG